MNSDMLIESARAWEKDWGERRTSGLITSLADLAEKQSAELAEANAVILKLRAEANEQRGRAEDAEHETRALRALRDGLTNREQVLTQELARIKGAGLSESIAEVERNIRQRSDHGATCAEETLLDAVRVLTAELAAEKAYSKCLTAGGEELTRDKNALFLQVQSMKQEVEQLRRNRDAMARGEVEALKMMATEKQRADICAAGIQAYRTTSFTLAQVWENEHGEAVPR